MRCLLLLLLLAPAAAAQPYLRGSAEARRAYLETVGPVQARATRMVLTRDTPAYRSAAGSDTLGMVRAGAVVTAYRAEHGRTAIATLEDGPMGWVATTSLRARDATEAARAAPVLSGTPPAVDRRTALYDSLTALPPSQLSERDLQWLQIYQEDRRTRASVQRAENGRVASKALGIYVGAAVGFTGLLLALALF